MESCLTSRDGLGPRSVGSARACDPRSKGHHGRGPQHRNRRPLFSTPGGVETVRVFILLVSVAVILSIASFSAAASNGIASGIPKSSGLGVFSNTSGPLPVLDGREVPPLASASNEASHGGGRRLGMNCLPDACYKAGVVYQGTTLSYNSVQVQIQVPSHPVRAGDGYFVLLSIYDNADSYDQIGFGKWGGSNHWGVTYSFTTGPCSTPNFISENNVKDIAEGQTYLFRMTLQLGQLIFSVQWNGATIWSLSFATQASAFIAENIHLCRDGSSWAGYTNYEEVFV